MFINSCLFVTQHFVAQNLLTRKREPSPERGRKKGPGAGENEKDVEEKDVEEEEEHKSGKRFSDSDIPTLWSLVCKKRITLMIQDGQEYLLCPNGACWPFHGQGEVEVKKLFIRQCYKDLFALWSNSDSKVEMLGGTWGVGKSTYVWYVLFMLMDAFHKDENKDKEQLTFLWFSRVWGTYLLSSDGSCVRDQNEFPPSVDYCFMEVGYNFRLSPRLARLRHSRTIIIAPPKSQQFELPYLIDAGIHPGITRDMPIWSKDEMVVVAKSIYGRSFNRKKFEAIFLIFGGCPHPFLMAYTYTDTKGGPVTPHYDTACRMFVDLLKTSTSLRRDGIPEMVEDLLKDQFIIRKFRYPSYVLSGDKDIPTLGCATSLLVHTNSTAPNYTNRELRVSSRFTELLIQQYDIPDSKLGMMFHSLS